jgi:hypothetical protein
MTGIVIVAAMALAMHSAPASAGSSSHFGIGRIEGAMY